MKKLIVMAIIAIVLVGCSPKPSPVIDNSATLVASTIAAWETSMAAPQPQQETPTPVPSITPTPTALVEVTPTFPPGYCNETWAKLVISQLKDVVASTEEDGQEIPPLDNDLALTDAQRLIIVTAIEIRMAKIELLPVPDCLVRAKELRLASYDGMKRLFSGNTPANEVLATLMAVGKASQESDAEIAKIEACLPTGCK